MVQFHTLVNCTVLLLCFAADLLWNFGLLGIHAAGSKPSNVCYACPKGTLGNDSLPYCRNCSNKGWCKDIQYCVKCSSGHYQNLTGQTKCIPCPRGYYQKDSGQATCLPCQKGHHQDDLGQSKCKPCPKGFFSGSTGGERCISCLFGGYCDELGCSQCYPCPAGTEAHRMGAQNCTPCNPGFFKESRSFHVCQLCKRGWYQVKSGQTTCKECPQGFYCPWQDALPIRCDPNQKCPQGSYSAGSECTLMYQRDEQTEKCELSSVVYAVIAVVVAVVLAAAGFGFVVMRRHKRKSEHRQRLLERQYPVYTGW